MRKVTNGIDTTGLQRSFFSLEKVQAFVHQMAVARIKMDLQFAWFHTFMSQNFAANNTLQFNHGVLNDACETHLEKKVSILDWNCNG